MQLSTSIPAGSSDGKENDLFGPIAQLLGLGGGGGGFGGNPFLGRRLAELRRRQELSDYALPAGPEVLGQGEPLQRMRPMQ